jgi:hypothetical protein
MALRMWSRAVFAALIAALGCASEVKDRSTPENALARLAPCVDRRDARCVYHELDRDSRWSVQTIQRTLAEMRGLVERSYPADRRSGRAIYGEWETAAAATDAPGVFAAFCERRRCMADLAAGLGTVVAVRRIDAGRAETTTTRGRTFALAAPDGAWGLAIYGAELAAEKIRLADKLAQVRIDAKAFEEQARATEGS